jgi:hypothetical protein
MVASTGASAVEQATRVQPAIVIPSIGTLTSVSDRLRIRSDLFEKDPLLRRIKEKFPDTEADVQELEDRLRSWVSTFTDILNACPNCRLLCPNNTVRRFAPELQERVVVADWLWKAKTFRIEHLIGAPAGRTAEEAARDAAHALYVLQALDDEEARRWAIDELGPYCSHNPRIQQAMLQIVKADQSGSFAAAERLSAAAMFPSDVVPFLVAGLGEQLNRGKGLIELRAPKIAITLPCAWMKALSHYGSDARAAVSCLIEALAYPDGDVVCEAARTLGRLGRNAVEALAALEQIARNPVNPAAWECAEAVRRIHA